MRTCETMNKSHYIEILLTVWAPWPMKWWHPVLIVVIYLQDHPVHCRTDAACGETKLEYPDVNISIVLFKKTFMQTIIKYISLDFF